MTTSTARFSTLLPLDELQKMTFEVIGCGAIGRQIALQLAMLNPKLLSLWDHDEVAIENVGVQGYNLKDIGKKKPEALAVSCDALNDKLNIIPNTRKWEKSKTSFDFSFVCVDSMSVRRDIAKAIGNRFFDSRMSARTGRIIYCEPEVNLEDYLKTVHDDKESMQEACTQRATPWCAAYAASLTVSQFSKWLRKWPVKYLPVDLTFNLDHCVLMETTSAEPEKEKAAVPTAPTLEGVPLTTPVAPTVTGVRTVNHTAEPANAPA